MCSRHDSPNYDPAWLDALASAGEVAWVGIEPLGQRDGRVAIYLADQVQALVPAVADDGLDARARR